MSAEITFVGLLVGFLIGLTGVGGGVLLTPLLIFLGIQPTIAVGTDLAYGAVTKIVGAVQHWRQGNVVWRWVVWAALGSVPASLAGTLVIHFLRLRLGSADAFLRPALGVVLVVVAAVYGLRELAPLLRRSRGVAGVSDRRVAGVLDSLLRTARRKALAVTLLGAAVGFLVGLTSVGSGSLFALVLLTLSRLDARYVVGTDVAQAAILVTAAASAHAVMGTVDWSLAANLLAGSLPGVLLGGRLTAHIPSRPLKVGLFSLIFLGGLKLI